MNNKLYGFSTFFVGEKTEIIEFDIIKETEKMFYIKCYSICKETMESCDKKFYLTKEEAVKGLIDYCKQLIECYNRDIKYRMDKNTELQNLIRKHGGSIDD